MSFTWTFGATSFRRLLGGDDDPRWFVATVATSVDVIATTGQHITDIGAIQRAPLTFVALCATASEAQALASALGTVATLTNPSGQTSSALMIEATRLVADGATERVRCTFAVVS
jgi:hypothetical protein